MMIFEKEEWKEGEIAKKAFERSVDDERDYLVWRKINPFVDPMCWMMDKGAPLDVAILCVCVYLSLPSDVCTTLSNEEGGA